MIAGMVARTHMAHCPLTRRCLTTKCAGSSTGVLLGNLPLEESLCRSPGSRSTFASPESLRRRKLWKPGLDPMVGSSTIQRAALRESTILNVRSAIRAFCCAPAYGCATIFTKMGAGRACGTGCTTAAGRRLGERSRASTLRVTKNTSRVVIPSGSGRGLVPRFSPSLTIRAKSATRMASRSMSTWSFMTIRREWLPPPVPEALRRLGVLQEVIRRSLNLGLRRLLEEVSRPLWYWVPARKLFDCRSEMSERGLLGSPALLATFRGPDGKCVYLSRALMGLTEPTREWMLRLKREYSDDRRARAEMPPKTGPGRVLRALVSRVSQAPLVAVGGVALGLAVVVAAVVIDEHPLLARVARAGQA